MQSGLRQWAKENTVSIRHSSDHDGRRYSLFQRRRFLPAEKEKCVDLAEKTEVKRTLPEVDREAAAPGAVF